MASVLPLPRRSCLARLPGCRHLPPVECYTLPLLCAPALLHLFTACATSSRGGNPPSLPATDPSPPVPALTRAATCPQFILDDFMGGFLFSLYQQKWRKFGWYLHMIMRSQDAVIVAAVMCALPAPRPPLAPRPLTRSLSCVRHAGGRGCGLTSAGWLMGRARLLRAAASQSLRSRCWPMRLLEIA